MWFQKKSPVKPPPPIETLGGFTLGQVVQHKIDLKRVVITEFSAPDDALAAFSSLPGDETWFSIHELEPAAAALAPPEGK